MARAWIVENDEVVRPIWCAHGDEWPWDPQHQTYTSPHDGAPDVVDPGALPDECQPARASREAWEDAKDRGTIQ